MDLNTFEKDSLKVASRVSSHQKILQTLVSSKPQACWNHQIQWVESFYSKNVSNLLFSQDQLVSEFLKTSPKRKKASQYKLHLHQRKKLRSFYGWISSNQLEKRVRESQGQPGHWSKNLINLLESRVDVTLYRCQFVKTLLSARQLINHQKVYVNHQLCSCSNFSLNPGDLISLDFKPKILDDSKFSEWSFENTSFPSLENLGNSGKIPVWFHLRALTLGLLKIAEIHGYFLLENLSERKSRGIPCFSNTPLLFSWTYSYSMNLTRGVSFSSCLPHLPNLIKRFGTGDSLSKPLEHSELLKLLLLSQTYSTKWRKSRKSPSWISTYGIKPVNLEISYKCLTFCYLYSPHRVHYPFFLDFQHLSV